MDVRAEHRTHTKKARDRLRAEGSRKRNRGLFVIRRKDSIVGFAHRGGAGSAFFAASSRAAASHSTVF